MNGVILRTALAVTVIVLAFPATSFGHRNGRGLERRHGSHLDGWLHRCKRRRGRAAGLDCLVRRVDADRDRPNAVPAPYADAVVLIESKAVGGSLGRPPPPLSLWGVGKTLTARLT